MLEVVIVVAIIAIAAAVVVPSVQAGRYQREVRRTMQDFVASVREASNRAMLQRRTIELWLSPDENGYALAVPERRGASKPHEAEGGAREADGDRTEDGYRILGRVALPAQASFGEIRGGRYLPREVIAVPFYPTGGSGGAAVEILFERPGSRQAYTIVIDPLTSDIAVEEGES